MDRVIMLADFAWRLSPESYAHLACTLFSVGKMHQAAALAQRTQLRIMDANSKHPPSTAGGSH
jgi:hypothetical protein